MLCKAQTACKAVKAKVSGGMPPGNFWKLHALRLIPVAFYKQETVKCLPISSFEFYIGKVDSLS